MLFTSEHPKTKAIVEVRHISHMLRLILSPVIKSATNNSPVINDRHDLVDTLDTTLINAHKIQEELLGFINTSFNDLTITPTVSRRFGPII